MNHCQLGNVNKEMIGQHERGNWGETKSLLKREVFEPIARTLKCVKLVDINEPLWEREIKRGIHEI